MRMTRLKSYIKFIGTFDIFMVISFCRGAQDNIRHIFCRNKHLKICNYTSAVWKIEGQDNAEILSEKYKLSYTYIEPCSGKSTMVCAEEFKTGRFRRASFQCTIFIQCSSNKLIGYILTGSRGCCRNYRQNEDEIIIKHGYQKISLNKFKGPLSI